MIKFSGEIRPDIRKKITWQWDRQYLCVVLFPAFAIAFGLMIAGICCMVQGKSAGFPLLMTGIIMLIGAIASCFAPLPSRMKRIDYFYTIVIADGEIQETQCDKQGKQSTFKIEMERIRKVIDYGEWYAIIFRGISNAVICQKELLIEGTLEEFETAFQGKLKRRKNDKKMKRA